MSLNFEKKREKQGRETEANEMMRKKGEQENETAALFWLIQ